MNRITVLAFVLATAAGSVLADDISVENAPLASSATRAQVQAELANFRQTGVNPYSRDYQPLAQFSSQHSRAEVSAEYRAARERVAAFTGEDSGSAFLARRVKGIAAAVTVAGQPLTAQ